MTEEIKADATQELIESIASETRPVAALRYE